MLVPNILFDESFVVECTFADPSTAINCECDGSGGTVIVVPSECIVSLAISGANGDSSSRVEAEECDVKDESK